MNANPDGPEHQPLRASIPPDERDMDLLADQWTALARALAGLAVVWVLPVQMTFLLSDTVGKPLSVYMGSWRFYRPGFNDRADQWQHPLVVVVNRLSEDSGPDMATTQFRRLAAEERLRFGSGDRDTLGFDGDSGRSGRGPSRNTETGCAPQKRDPARFWGDR